VFFSEHSVDSNSTSAQLGYTVPFMLVHARKYRTEGKLKLQTIQSPHGTPQLHH